MGFLTPLYPIIMDKFGLSLSLVGAVSMVAALASALSQPFFGMLFDRFGFSASLYLAPLLTGLLVSCLGIAPSFTVFLVILCLGCLGSAAFHPKGASVTPTLSGSHAAVGMAIFSAGGNLGFAAGPAVIAYFISVWGFHATPVLAVPAAQSWQGAWRCCSPSTSFAHGLPARRGSACGRSPPTAPTSPCSCGWCSSISP